jgi:hypothetical protein
LIYGDGRWGVKLKEKELADRLGQAVLDNAAADGGFADA